jgi:hypothetical protein
LHYRFCEINTEVDDMQKLTLATLLGAGMLTIAACDNTANDGAPQTPAVSFEDADANDDGRITSQEALNVPGIDFDRMDADKNSAVSPQEYATAMAMSTPRG